MITLTKTTTAKRRINRAQSGKEYIMEGFLEPGLVSYDDVGAGVARLNKEAIDKMLPSFVGCPITIDHVEESKDEVLNGKAGEDGKPLKRGEVTRAWWNADTGKFDCAFTVEDKEADELVKNGVSGSCAYNVTETGPGGELHAMAYDEEITNGAFEHLALVTNPRYEDCKIRVNSKPAKINAQENIRLKVQKTSKDIWSLVGVSQKHGGNGAEAILFKSRDEAIEKGRALEAETKDEPRPYKLFSIENAKMACVECGATFSHKNPSVETRCPKCHGYDVEVANSKENDVDKQKMFDKEKADHPEFTDEQIWKIVEDHEAIGENAKPEDKMTDKEWADKKAAEYKKAMADKKNSVRETSAPYKDGAWWFVDIIYGDNGNTKKKFSSQQEADAWIQSEKSKKQNAQKGDMVHIDTSAAGVPKGTAGVIVRVSGNELTVRTTKGDVRVREGEVIVIPENDHFNDKTITLNNGMGYKLDQVIGFMKNAARSGYSVEAIINGEHYPVETEKKNDNGQIVLKNA